MKMTETFSQHFSKENMIKQSQLHHSHTRTQKNAFSLKIDTSLQFHTVFKNLF